MADLRADAERFTSSLRALLGDRLRSVVLHGSVARGEAVAGVSDVNLMVLVDAADPELLRLLAPRAREWLEKDRALPLVLTWDEWQDSTDSFAIETADMLDARAVLAGNDPVAGLTVRPEELRLQAERELRVKLIHLREGVLATADRPKELGRLLVAALPSLATYLRTCLRLARRPVPSGTPEVLRQGAALVGASPEPLVSLWTERAAGRSPRADAGDDVVRSIHELLEKTVAYVDTFDGERVE